jgi:1-deoxy-D-xylulose-5-phosphate reductoisomerase
MSQSRCISILGSTGSVGQSTLSVISANPGHKIHALSAHRNIELLLDQCLQYQPEYAVVTDPDRVAEMQQLLLDHNCNTRLLSGATALDQIASAEVVDTVMAAIVGSAGLASSMAAVSAGKRVLLANKEALVMAGDLFIDTARKAGATIIPIDSEHNAVFQCLPKAGDEQMAGVEKIVLTASGGPFLDTPLSQLAQVTPAQACDHPKWSMGRKISVDSATMMNKGLEVIEASLLFGLPASRIEVLIHPQSIVHSMVYYQDGSVLAQLGAPDMRIPIACGLAYPERCDSGAPRLDLVSEQALEFRLPDLERFPCLRLGIEAAAERGTRPALLNAANEEAVAAFLARKLAFTRIPRIIDAVMSKIPCEPASSLAIIQDCDQRARILAKELILKDI